MESTLSPDKTASAIWGRVVKPDRGTLTPEAARSILKLDFDPEDHGASIGSPPRPRRAPSQPRSGPSSRSMSGSTPN